MNFKQKVLTERSPTITTLEMRSEGFDPNQAISVDGNINAIGMMDLADSMDVFGRWCEKRVTHLVSSSDVIADSIYDLTHDGISSTTLEELCQNEVVLEDGRLVQFEYEERHEQLYVWIGESFQKLDLTWRNGKAYIDDSCKDGLENLADICDDVNDEQIEFLNYARNLSSSLASDGQSANAILSAGLASGVSKVHEVADVISALPARDRLRGLASYIADSFSQLSSNISTAESDDDDAGEFDPASYNGVKTASFAAGAWSYISSAVTGIGTLAMTFGGPILKVVGALGLGAAWVINTVKDAATSTEYMKYDEDANNQAFANAIRFSLPGATPESLKIINPSGYVMISKDSTGVKGLMYPKALSPRTAIYPTARPTDWYCCLKYNNSTSQYETKFLRMDSVATASEQRVIASAANPESLNGWQVYDDPSKQEAGCINMISYNLFTTMFSTLARENALIRARNATSTSSLAAWEGPIPDMNGSYTYRPDNIGAYFRGEELLNTTYGYEFKQIFDGLSAAVRCICDTSPGSQNKIWNQYLLWTHDLNRIIEEHGSWADVSPTTILSWQDLYQLMDGELSLNGDDDGYTPVGYHSAYRTIAHLGTNWAIASGAEKTRLEGVLKTWSVPDVIMSAVAAGFNYVLSAVRGAVYHTELGTPESVAEAMLNGGNDVISVGSTVTYVPSVLCATTPNPRVFDHPVITPPKFSRGTILKAVVITSVVLAATIAVTVFVSIKVKRHRKLKARRREQDAIAAQDRLASLNPSDPEYRQAEKEYLRSQRKFQKYASKVGYSSNSVGSYQSGEVSEMIQNLPSNTESAASEAEVLPEISKMIFGAGA